MTTLYGLLQVYSSNRIIRCLCLFPLPGVTITTGGLTVNAQMTVAAGGVNIGIAGLTGRSRV